MEEREYERNDRERRGKEKVKKERSMRIMETLRVRMLKDLMPSGEGKKTR